LEKNPIHPIGFAPSPCLVHPGDYPSTSGIQRPIEESTNSWYTGPRCWFGYKQALPASRLGPAWHTRREPLEDVPHIATT